MAMARLNSTEAMSTPNASIAPESATAPQAPPLGSHLSMVTTIIGLAGLEAGWRRLEKTGARPHAVFQSYDWVRSWARSYATPGSGNELCIVTGHRGDELAFIWPLMRTNCGPVKVLRWLSEPLAQYGDVLTAPGECPKTWLAAAIDLLQQLRNVDTIWLRHVRDDAIAAPFLQESFRDARLVEQAPWLDLSAYADEAAYDARYNSNQRKRRKKIRKSLEDAFGPLKFEMLDAGGCNEAAMRDAIAEKCKWLEERGRQNVIIGSSQLLEFLKDLSRSRGTSTKLVTSIMSAGDQVLSWEIGLRFGKSHFGFITSHVNELTDYSAARLHMDHSQRRALADGMEVFDLMVPHDAHKESWSSAAMVTRDYHLPVSRLGWIYGRLYLETARPALREAYYRMPAKALRLLKPLTGH